MAKIYATILSLIISCFVTYDLIVPSSQIFGLEDSTAVNRLVGPSDYPHSSATAEQTPNDNPKEVDTTSKIEPQKTDDLKSEKGSSEQSGQNDKPSLSDERISHSRSPAQTAGDFSSTDMTPPGRVRAVTMKVVSGNQIDLRWAGVKEYDLNHYNVYMNTKPSFEVSPGVTVPNGISYTNSFSSIGLNPSTTYYYKIAAVDDANNIGPISNTKPGMTKGAAKSTQNDSPDEKTKVTATSTQRDGPAQELTGLASLHLLRILHHQLK